MTTPSRRLLLWFLFAVALLAAAGRAARAVENPALQAGSGLREGAVVERPRDSLPPVRVIFEQEFPAGVGHIMTGPDHICFVIALALVAQTAWGLFGVVSFFTLAHALTLTLASLNVVRLGAAGGAAIEFGVAASICWVALENVIYRGRTHHRSLVAFGFGLVHGYAFSEHFRASMLNVDLAVWANLGKFLMKVLSFNLGVDAGQSMVVYSTFAVILLLRRHAAARAPQVVRIGSTVIAIAGAVWMVDRVWTLARLLGGRT